MRKDNGEKATGVTSLGAPVVCVMLIKTRAKMKHAAEGVVHNGDMATGRARRREVQGEVMTSDKWWMSSLERKPLDPLGADLAPWGNAREGM